MDEWGCMKNTENDFAEISDCLRIFRRVSFCYSADNYTAFVITISGPCFQLGTMSWGGPINQLYNVAVRLRGNDYFDFLGKPIEHYDLTDVTDNKSDREVLAELLQGLQKAMKKT